jgi:hypothetical protein
MIIFINGAFGVGKTAVAKALRSRLTGARLHDPEPAGLLLRYLSLGRHFDGRIIDDFQDMPMWRRATLAGLRLARSRARHIIVPMAFSNLAYLEEVIGGTRLFEPDVRLFCLIAPLEAVRERLLNRGVRPESRKGKWVWRRAQECCAAHSNPAFGEPVDTAGRTVECIVDDLERRLEVAEGQTR